MCFTKGKNQLYSCAVARGYINFIPVVSDTTKARQLIYYLVILIRYTCF